MKKVLFILVASFIGCQPIGAHPLGVKDPDRWQLKEPYINLPANTWLEEKIVCRFSYKVMKVKFYNPTTEEVHFKYVGLWLEDMYGVQSNKRARCYGGKK